MDSRGLTTITLTQQTKNKLEKLKIHSRQSFDELVLNLLEEKNNGNRKKH